MPRPLPIDPLLPEILRCLDDSRTLVLEAEPGSGKTTRVPPALLDRVDGRVWVLEPRRLAARAAARWVARERGGEVGAEVGYQVRHDKRVSGATRLVFVTEGILVRRLLADPFLDGVGAVVLDEFHERHLDSDLALAMLQEVRATVRPELRLVVMSATLDAAPLLDFLGADHVVGEGKVHPVETVWAQHRDDRPLAVRVRDAVANALESTEGHVLVFLPGVGEIKDAGDELRVLARREAVTVLPLHGSLTAEDQDRAVRPSESRKVVLATNVAESSVTVDGVTAVVDSGLARILRHDASRGLDVLGLERNSLASAAQRRGRAGRTGPGKCFRLWMRGEERTMPAQDTPELARIDISGAVLAVRRFAGRSALDFGWFEKPDAVAIERADRLLELIGAVDHDGRVTEVGESMLALPLEPRLSRMVVAAREHDCVWEVAGLAALLSERDVLRRDAEVVDDEAGLLARARLVEQARRDKFSESACRRLGLNPGAVRAVARSQKQIAAGAAPNPSACEEDLARAVLAAFPDRVAKRHRGHRDEATLVAGSSFRILPGCLPDAAELLLALDLQGRRGRGRSRPGVSLALPIERAWLADVAPIEVEDVAVLDEKEGRVRGVKRTRFLDLVLDEAQGGEPDFEQARALVAPLLRKDPWRWLGARKPVHELLARIAWLAREAPELDILAIGDDTIAELALDLFDGRDLAKLRDAPLESSILAKCRGVALERHAPERLKLPSGRMAKIDYAAEAGPTVSARLQEFFGARDVPRLAGGRVTVILELLAPNMRPVQVTRDLPSFWDNVYPRVRSELKRRYPKHSWPEDPWAAEPESRPRRRRR